MVDKKQVQLGPVQETLLITLAGRAKETTRKRPMLRDPKAVRILESIDYDVDKYGKNAGGTITVLRTLILDSWVRAFLADHPGGTVVELGTGLNTRFERVDNGTVHWVDVDLPDTIELRRNFFTDTDRRQMISASVLDDDWQQAVAEQPGPYFFVAEGVLVYLPEDDVLRTLGGIATRFPGAFVALDTYRKRMVEQQHKMADRRNMQARWAWGVDEPRELGGRLGMRVVESTPVTRPPKAIRDRLPRGYRVLLPVLDKALQGFGSLTLLQ
ncbi:MAG TPA: class I SAM-dependent methyltransferase [Pseudonocardiaceae bacterium]|jgi:O-methyltransferase involved in polyketide biosynthesis